MECIIFWAVCGAIAGYIYRHKGRSEWVGCIGGFLLGPLGIFLALITAKDESALEREAIASGEAKRCPYCAEIIRAEASVCKHCGHDIYEKAKNSL